MLLLLMPGSLAYKLNCALNNYFEHARANSYVGQLSTISNNSQNNGIALHITDKNIEKKKVKFFNICN